MSNISQQPRPSKNIFAALADELCKCGGDGKYVAHQLAETFAWIAGNEVGHDNEALVKEFIRLTTTTPKMPRPLKND